MNMNPMSNEQLSRRVRVGRTIFQVLAWLFLICVVLQVFFAGMAVFTDASYWSWHVKFVRMFEIVPILMLIFSFVGKLPVRLRWLSAGLYVLLSLQHVTVIFQSQLWIGAAVHPVIALVLFWGAVTATRRAKYQIKP